MPKTINPIRAVQIAESWHGGQFTELYAFASTGRWNDTQRLLNEIDSDLNNATGMNKISLNALRKFVETHSGKYESK